MRQMSGQRGLKVVYSMGRSILRTEFREFIAECEQFPRTEILCVTLGIIDLKHIFFSDCSGRILILFNALTFFVKCFFTESICTNKW